MYRRLTALQRRSVGTNEITECLTSDAESSNRLIQSLQQQTTDWSLVRRKFWRKTGTITSLSPRDLSSQRRIFAAPVSDSLIELPLQMCWEARATKKLTATVCFSVKSPFDVVLLELVRSTGVFLWLEFKGDDQQATFFFEVIVNVRELYRCQHTVPSWNRLIWIHLILFGGWNNSYHYWWVTHSSTEKSKWGKRPKHSVIYFYSAVPTWEMPVMLQI